MIETSFVTDAHPQSCPPVLVLGLDGSDGSNAALRWCCETAPRLDAEVIAVYTLAPLVAYVPVPLVPAAPPYGASMRTDVEAALEGWCADLRSAGVRCRTVVVDGLPTEALMRVSDQEDDSWIVVGRRGRGGFMGMVLGSVPHALSLHAQVPVVIIPAPDAVAE